MTNTVQLIVFQISVFGSTTTQDLQQYVLFLNTSYTHYDRMIVEIYLQLTLRAMGRHGKKEVKRRI